MNVLLDLLIVLCVLSVVFGIVLVMAEDMAGTEIDPLERRR